jgi:hypothetical protein
MRDVVIDVGNVGFGDFKSGKACGVCDVLTVT